MTISFLFSCVLVYAEVSGTGTDTPKPDASTIQTPADEASSGRGGARETPDAETQTADVTDTKPAMTESPTVDVAGESSEAEKSPEIESAATGDPPPDGTSPDTEDTVAGSTAGSAVPETQSAGGSGNEPVSDTQGQGTATAAMLPDEERVPDEKPAEIPKPPPDPIAMESDRATINREKRIIELVGNVKVSQGPTIITANMLRLFLKEGAKLETPQKSGENSIDKVVASGNVKFQLDIGTAYSDRAEYITTTKLLVLTGKEPKFVSGENTITGSRITVNRESGMVTFEGGKKSRVEAVIYSDEQL